ncbi:hypothetical protein [Leucobacter sp. USHLN153]|uniref:hypothetical protein n=1 Tax=Leucobacter sp. USHLN153 TaxID=3081268 RepID=UPI003017F62A
MEAMRDVAPARRLVRASYDLHSVARLEPTESGTTIVKHGGRVTLVDVWISQLGSECARARLYFADDLPPRENEIWTSADSIDPPALGSEKDYHGRQYYSDSTGWTALGSQIPGDERKAIWVGGVELIRGECLESTVLAGFAADGVNPIMSWGRDGIQHINLDVSLHLARQPVPGGIGLLSARVLVSGGTLVGSAQVFDRLGALGVASMTSIAQERRVDPSRWRPQGASPSIGSA